MRKISLIILAFIALSCNQNRDVLLAKSAVSLQKEVEDHSPIYIFFTKKGKDTVAELNRKNSIISTNWIVNVDKRLTLKHCLPEIIKIQEKKRKEKAHKNEKAENYYSYADTVGKNLAFLKFTKVYYILKKPNSSLNQIKFEKNGNISLISNTSAKPINKVELEHILNSDAVNFVFCFDKKMPFQSYLDFQVFLNQTLPQNYLMQKRNEYFF